MAERLKVPQERRPLEVAYIGRLVQSQKRVLDLAPLVRELARRNLPFVLHLIGSGEDAPRLREELARAEVGHHVRWWGWLARTEVGARLRQLDALVLPSDVEGLPLALLEAMGQGVVPVATRIPSGNTELVRDGENGFLAAVGDTNAFANRLEQLYLDPGLLTRLRRAAWVTSEVLRRSHGVGIRVMLHGGRRACPAPIRGLPRHAVMPLALPALDAQGEMAPLRCSARSRAEAAAEIPRTRRGPVPRHTGRARLIKACATRRLSGAHRPRPRSMAGGRSASPARPTRDPRRSGGAGRRPGGSSTRRHSKDRIEVHELDAQRPCEGTQHRLGPSVAALELVRERKTDHDETGSRRSNGGGEASEEAAEPLALRTGRVEPLDLIQSGQRLRP